MDGSGTAEQVDRAALSPCDSTAGASHTREVDPLEVTQRLQREGRWKDIEPERNEMMRKVRKGKDKLSKEEAQIWTYAELDRLYPPLPSSGKTSVQGGEQNGTMTHFVTNPQASLSSQKVDDGSIRGLSDIPDAWPVLPANASLAADVAWVQANRLRVVEDKPIGPTVVHLELALSPAPSWAALGWLETSIRSYAKWVDVCARASSGDDGGEHGVMRRERVAIEEVDALLEEMMDDDDR